MGRRPGRVSLYHQQAACGVYLDGLRKIKKADFVGRGDQNQNREQGEKENPNDNGERKRECSRLCIDCEAPIDRDCPICPECGCPQPD